MVKVSWRKHEKVNAMVCNIYKSKFLPEMSPFTGEHQALLELLSNLCVIEYTANHIPNYHEIVIKNKGDNNV